MQTSTFLNKRQINFHYILIKFNLDMILKLIIHNKS